ncbi:NAD(P)-dependent oxidoreductase [Rivularia sp. UHCC 0363]|uniref:SDR family oxidoreductase n=1 Tax=Rivularia sp. UHCC 0363 TaxID=3110244 RepID=UPI002B212C5A|nr:NAD(P)-dependent oxidoreductase [Rivularia sp. UHCC 0363]MEA5593475.1 NAD(P)-dependent oxidoreductase [Rivularia sp. UHCC 0363]
MKKLLITGASGFLGWHLCQLANIEWEVYGTYFSHRLEIPGVKLVKIDLTNFAELKRVFQEIQPFSVIHTAAQSQPNYCQIHVEESRLINVTVSLNLAELCAENSIPYVFTSTDLVFDGLKGFYKETDSVNPVNIYGEHKVIAEIGILERYPQATICRMPLMFGNATPTASSFLQSFIKTLQEGKELKLFVDEFRTPVNGKTAAEGLLLALEQVSGIIHLGGTQRISRYDFGLLLAEIFEIPAAKIQVSRQQDVKMAAPRPSDVSLDSSKAFELGYAPLSLKEQLLQVKGQRLIVKSNSNL